MGEVIDERLVGAFKSLKLGSILMLLSDILVIASFLPFVLTMPKFMRWISRQEAPRSLREILAPLMPGIVSTIILLLAALLIGLIALYLWYRASTGFKHYDDKFSVGRIGATLSLIGSLTLAISLAAVSYWVILNLPPAPQRPSEERIILALASLLPGVLGIVLGVVIYLIGWVLYGVMIMRLSEVPGAGPDFKYAGILMIAGALLSVLGSLGVLGALLEMASLIMIFVYSDTALKSFRAKRGSDST